MKVCVFCGSSMGKNGAYREGALLLAAELIASKCELLYGGANVGLMKVIADAMLQAGCRVVGVMPRHLVDMEVAHHGLTEMIVVDSMGERKFRLENDADAFIAMPGGFGTMDEVFEVAVLSQLRILDKPVAFYNINGYYDKLLDFLEHAVNEGFIRNEHLDNIIVSDDPKVLLDKISHFKPVETRKWIDDIHHESKNDMKIIGITGTLGAGKGTIVDYLINEKNFVHYSVRAFISEEVKRRGMEVNRDTMTVVANDLRAKHTPSYITDQLYEIAAREGKDAVIESIRTPGEITSLRSKSEFTLFAVDADQRIRYDRIAIRGSETDSVSFETFVMNEQREMSSTDPNKQNLGECIRQADYVFNNNGTIEDLYQQVEKVLQEMEVRQ